MNNVFDPIKEKLALQEQTKVLRKRTYKKSRLDRYKGEILALYKVGVSATEVQRWLRARRIKVVLSTVTRWLEKNASLS